MSPEEKRMKEIEKTTMCVLKNGEKVLMINRKNNWLGWAFPGGHLENNETFEECVKREMLEETGLEVAKLEYKGTVDVFNPNTKKHLLVSNYLSEHYTGTLKEECDEGELQWINIYDIDSMKVAEGLEYRLPLFFEDGIIDLYIELDKSYHYAKVEYKTMRG